MIVAENLNFEAFIDSTAKRLIMNFNEVFFLCIFVSIRLTKNEFPFVADLCQHNKI